MSDWIDLPLFPLNTVLFPGMVLPLHIFEERYKLMIERCIEESRPFGVVLIREGHEVGESAVPYNVGTTSVIAGVSRLDDGDMNIVTVGSERFRLTSIRRDLPYMVGDAEPWPILGASTDESEELVAPVRALFRHYLSQLQQAQGRDIQIEEVPTEPLALAILVAISLQLPMPDKQELLHQPTVVRMLSREMFILRREQLILDHIIQTQEDQWEGGHSGFLAKN